MELYVISDLIYSRSQNPYYAANFGERYFYAIQVRLAKHWSPFHLLGELLRLNPLMITDTPESWWLLAC